MAKDKLELARGPRPHVPGGRMAEALTRMMLEERRFPRLVRFVQVLRKWRAVTVAFVVAAMAVVFVADVIAVGWFIISGFYLLPLSASAVILRFRPTLYLCGVALALSGAVMLARRAEGPEPLLFYLFEVLACVGLLVLSHLLSQVDRISRRAGLRARYAEAVADIAGMSGSGESADEIVAFALDRIRVEIGAQAALVLRLRDGVWSGVAAHGVDVAAGELRLPFAVLQDAARSLEEDGAIIGASCLDRTALADVDDARILSAAEALSPLRSCLSVPLRAHGEELGVVVLGRTEADSSFAADQVRFAESVAGYTAVALDSARLTRELAARERDLSLVVASSLDFAASLDLGEVLRAVIGRLTAALSVSQCDIYSVDLDREKLIALAGIDVDDPRRVSTPGTEIDMRRWASTVAAIESGSTVVVYGSQDERLSTEETRYFDLRGFTGLLALPLKARDRVIGLVELFDRDAGRRFTQSEIDLAEAVGQFAALAIDNAR
ncbi:MAG: GAF domain-containing protein, partial [Armatimonadetes bacterium]|nr:GAF domain-containing protein [Armatimonadota bacterium]